MTEIQLLQKTREILRFKGWTRGVMARDEAGQEVGSTSSQAATFCLVGACHRAFHELDGDWENREETNTYIHMTDLLTSCVIARRQDGFSVMSRFNDAPETTFDQVLEVIDCGMAKLTAAGGTIEADGN